MHGGVGTGKTMLMDLLVGSAPPEFKVWSNTRTTQNAGQLTLLHMSTKLLLATASCVQSLPFINHILQ